jgi:hypothetical protein
MPEGSIERAVAILTAAPSCRVRCSVRKAVPSPEPIDASAHGWLDLRRRITLLRAVFLTQRMVEEGPDGERRPATSRLLLRALKRPVWISYCPDGAYVARGRARKWRRFGTTSASGQVVNDPLWLVDLITGADLGWSALREPDLSGAAYECEVDLAAVSAPSLQAITRPPIVDHQGRRTGAVARAACVRARIAETGAVDRISALLLADGSDQESDLWWTADFTDLGADTSFLSCPPGAPPKRDFTR